MKRFMRASFPRLAHRQANCFARSRTGPWMAEEAGLGVLICIHSDIDILQSCPFN